MPIQTVCTGCNASYSVPEAYAGKQIRCKKCQQSITVPGAAPAPAPAPAAPQIQATCPSCHAVYKLPETARGKSARCKKCQTPFVVGAPAPEEELVAIEAVPRV